MGFFFQDVGNNTTKTKHSLDIAYQQGCRVCPIRDGEHLIHKDIPASGSDSPILYIVGEAAGKSTFMSIHYLGND